VGIRVRVADPPLDAGSALRFASAMQTIRLASCVVSLCLAVGCASTKLVSAWQNPAYTGGPIKKIMIVALGAAPGGRAEFENDMADALVAHGVIGVGSNGYFANAAELTRENVRTWVIRDDYQGVLVARVESLQQTRYVNPPQYTDLWGYWGYYGVAYGIAVTPGSVVDVIKLRISSDLFEAPGGQVVYTAELKSDDPPSREKLINDLVELLVTDLTKRGLLPPKR
jgi:hypothetical protein